MANTLALTANDLQSLSTKLSFYGNASDVVNYNWARVVDGEFDATVPEMTLDEWQTCLLSFLRRRVGRKSYCAKWTFVGQYVWGFRYGERAPNGVVEIVRFTKRYQSNMERVNDPEMVY